MSLTRSTVKARSRLRSTTPFSPAPAVTASSSGGHRSKTVGPSQPYFNGSDVATPQNTNNVLRSATATSNPLTAYNSISDEYLLQAGVAASVTHVSGLSVTFGPRHEGGARQRSYWQESRFPPAGLRHFARNRIQYARNGNVFSIDIAHAIYRDRTRSVPDVMTGAHGDEAFADWVWFANYSFRYGGFHRSAHRSGNMPDHS